MTYKTRCLWTGTSDALSRSPSNLELPYPQWFAVVRIRPYEVSIAVNMGAAFKLQAIAL